MDYCCTLGLPTLLLYNKLLVQYFEKEIYVEMCIFHCKPFFVKPQGFFAFNCQNPEKSFLVQGNPDFTVQACTDMGHKQL